MGTIFIPEDNEYYNVVGNGSKEISRIRDAAPAHPGTVYVYVLGRRDQSPFSVGQKVYVKSPNYDFSATIWYTYQGADGYNLYLKTAYKGDDFSGSVSTSPIIEIPSADILTTNEQVSTAIDTGIGTGAPLVEGAVKAVSSPKNWLFIGIAAALGFITWKRFGKKGKK